MIRATPWSDHTKSAMAGHGGAPLRKNGRLDGHTCCLLMPWMPTTSICPPRDYVTCELPPLWKEDWPAWLQLRAITVDLRLSCIHKSCYRSFPTNPEQSILIRLSTL